MEARLLIKSIEGNFREYYRILNSLEEEVALPGSGGVPRHIVDLLVALVEIQDEIVDFRLKKILKEEHPYLPKLEVHQLRRQQGDDLPSFKELCERFLTKRKELLKLLYSLPLENWERTGVLEAEGHISFGEFVRRMGDKDAQMLARLHQVCRPHEALPADSSMKRS